MRGIKLLLIVLFAGLVIPASAQTDTTVIKVDSTFRKPGTRVSPRDTVDNDSARIIPRRSRNRQRLQQDTVVKDSARLAIEKMPRKAAIRSAILPGLGQLYNRRWWKVPLVYGGFVAIGLIYEFNQRYYHEFLGEAQYRFENRKPKDPRYAPYSDEGIIAAKDYYRRNRDLSILGGIAFHAVQIIDAYVDAKFFRYDIGDELSLRIQPSVIRTQPFIHAYTPVAGIKLKLSL